ncbi:MAG: hypothetical protein ACI81L_000745 [Verrucomicrobiales bacterium]|jgi:hypothetical protein
MSAARPSAKPFERCPRRETLYKPTPDAARRRELAGIITPEIEALCEKWYARSVGTPASVLNTRGPISASETAHK